jgi:hypothetical protein
MKQTVYKNLMMLPVAGIGWLLFAKVHSQTTTSQNLFFIKNGLHPVTSDKDYKPRKEGFFIYRNCVYDLVLKNKLQLSAKIIDVKNDSLYYTLYTKENELQHHGDRQDTFHLHPSQIRRIKMIGDRLMGIYSNCYVNHYKYVFEQSLEPKKLNTDFKTIYSADSTNSTTYEVVPYLTAQGLDLLYQQCGATYYYEGKIQEDCPDVIPEKFIRKKGVWFSPTNANEVRGINIGIQTMNARGGPLNIDGVNLNADILSFFLGVMALPQVPFNNSLVNMPDAADTSSVVNKIRGMSLSVGGLAGGNETNGVSINGGIFLAVETKGVVLTGSQNIIDHFRGAVFSLLRNRSIGGKGVQVGLLNICKHMKGIQIGLWNVNSKRKLPLINWSFKS